MNRRLFLRASSMAAVGSRTLLAAPAIISSERLRPAMPCGLQSGDVAGGQAIIWARTDRRAQMIVDFATTESFRNASRINGPVAHEATDFTARIDLRALPPGQRIFYRVAFQDNLNPKISSAPLTGMLRTPPRGARDLLFAWSGDTAGQGWGINPGWGGMKIFESIRNLQPDFFIHSGDTIYADGPLQAEVRLDDNSIWKNIVTAEKSKVAETLDEFRGQYRYNLLDENLRRFNAEVPQFVQWDDHETYNNWFPERILDDPRYRVRDCRVLAARSKRAFLDYQPIRFNPRDRERIFRAYHYGSSLDLFMLDERSYRGRNSPNRQTTMSARTAFLGQPQMRWLKSQLLASRSTWKVIASDMPIGIIVRDGKENFENAANGDGPALGRELEIAELLRFIKRHHIKNVVWLTADVHYAAAHHYDPSRAQFTDFNPFWEFVAGPLHAGTFGPGEMDNTFGPEVKFTGIPQGMKPNRPPSDGFQFFGSVRIDGRTEEMTVKIHDLYGKPIYSVDLMPNQK